MKPLRDYVVVMREEKKDRTESGLYVVAFAPEYQPVGIVHKIGSEVKNVHIGQKVLFKPHSGQEIELNDNRYLVMKEEHIVVVLED